MTPDKQKKAVNGGNSRPIEKPMDRPFPSYRNDESTPRDTFHEMPLDEGLMENHGDLSKRFS